MKGYKNSTKTVYETESSANYGKGGKAMAKVGKVMGEFKRGTLHSGSKKGPEVKSPKQAIAIALNEARGAGAKIPMRKAEGGKVKAPKAKPYDPVKDEPTSRPLTADQVRNIRNQMKAPKPPAKRAYDPVLDEPTSRAFKKGGYVKKQLGGLLAEREMAARGMVGKAKGGAASAVHKHERNMHPGKPLTKMRTGGKVGF
ncbi:MAG: DUF6496 domain-containing protein [Pseudomonadota bacterium]